MNSKTSIMVCVLGWFSIFAPPLRAQQAADESTIYQGLVGEALAEFDRGHFLEARALFLKAHGLRPSARTVRGLGLASFELREYVAAIGYLEKALASRENPLDDLLRDKTQLLLTRARSFVGTYTLRVEPPVARVRVDGAPVALAAPLLLDIGPHVVSVDAPTYISETRPLRVLGGEEHALEFALVPLAPPVAASPGPDIAPPPGPSVEAASAPTRLLAGSELTPRVDDARDPRRMRRIWLWTAAAVVVMGSAGVITGLMLSRHRDEAEVGEPSATPTTAGILLALGARG